MAVDLDVYLTVQDAMTYEERRAFLANFTRRNPHWSGAHVADVLSALDDSDSNLDVVEPLYEAHGDEMGERKWWIGPCALAVLWTHGAAPWGLVLELIGRCAAPSAQEGE